MKVIFVPSFPFTFTPPGGGRMQVLKTKEYLEKLGIEVKFWNPEKNYAFDKDGDIFHIFSSDWPLAQLAMLIKKLGYPYVVSPIFWEPNWFKALAHKVLSQIPLTQTNWRKRLLKEADLLLPNSNFEAKHISKIFNIPLEKFWVVPNAVDSDFIGLDPDRFWDTYIPELSKNERFILSVATIEPRKNTLSLIKAACKIEAPLVLIGPESTLHQQYVQQVKDEIEKAKKKIFIKHIPGIYDRTMLANAFSASWVHALVSFIETPGISTLEAGLNGANLVVSRLVPVLEYVGDYSWSVDPHNIESIAKGLEEALNSPRNSKNVKDHIKNNFTWQVAAKKTLEGYRKVLES
jgi:glycosyltransferase involved in cell wall biosynthesis